MSWDSHDYIYIASLLAKGVKLKGSDWCCQAPWLVLLPLSSPGLYSVSCGPTPLENVYIQGWSHPLQHKCFQQPELQSYVSSHAARPITTIAFFCKHFTECQILLYFSTFLSFSTLCFLSFLQTYTELSCPNTALIK